MTAKIFNESGHGYWLEGFGCLRAGGGYNDMNTSHAIVILNDQGGAVLDVSHDVTACLRAQEHGHQPIACYSISNHCCDVNDRITETLRAECHGAMPVVCFEPGILSRDCSAVNRAYMNICSTLIADMGDNKPAVCYETSSK